MEILAGLFAYGALAVICLRFFVHVRVCDKHMRRILADHAPVEQDITNVV